ncbi:MAG: radical SAM protein [Ignisphaera sp.]|nr:radical SAM protein [Ignisphaera sp.]MCX8167531.1 radical SAM protein [Ignisphaera sp.]MDW8086017.1 radical SAM protein [Ignisphaera sp.]
MLGYNPFELSEAVRRVVTRSISGVEARRYYRFRGGRWYGGVATGDVVGCNLRCIFCWSWRYSHFTNKGTYYTPQLVFKNLIDIASSKGYKYVRLSGGEPTISWNHLLTLLDLFNQTGYAFILETNGLLIGKHKEYAKQLAKYDVVVRVSFKGTSTDEFSMLTGARPEFFEYQFKSLENLLECGMRPGEDFYPAVMLSFTTDENYAKFRKRLEEIHPVLAQAIDEEYVILYPHVVEILNRSRVKPKIAFSPNNIPQYMI